MLIIRDHDRPEPTLVKMTVTEILVESTVPQDMRRGQPFHVSGDAVVAKCSQNQVPVVRHDAVPEDVYPRLLSTLFQEADERLIVRPVDKDRPPVNRPIDNVSDGPCG